MELIKEDALEARFYGVCQWLAMTDLCPSFESVRVRTLKFGKVYVSQIAKISSLNRAFSH